jgi:bifunctional non-homologous end joining protein LigD
MRSGTGEKLHGVLPGFSNILGGQDFADGPLTMAKARTTIEVAGLRFTSPERLVYPKLELAEHYMAVAGAMLPHLRTRPVTMIRCPDNYKACFFQKHIDEKAHYQGVTAVRIKEDKGTGLYATVDSLKGLIALVQLGVVEFHTPGVRRDKLGQPDRFILDLDPDPSVGWARVVEAACALRDLLQEMGLKSYAKTTGGKGLHVVCPIRRSRSTEEVRAFTGALAGMFESVAPKRYTTNVSKSKRTDRILIDYLRNAPGATAVEVFSARAREGAPVAMPVAWDELDDVRGDTFTVRNAKDRLAKQRTDPWEDFFDVRQSITARMMEQVGL